MGFISQHSEFSAHIHPGIDVNNLSEGCKNFLKKEHMEALRQLDPTETLSNKWPSFCDWLKKVSPNGNVLLIAQQAQRNDEKVLACEMARNNLQWPEGLNIMVVDLLPYIKPILDPTGDFRGSWAVSAVYKRLTGKTHTNKHNALEDAKCLLENAKAAWRLKFLGKLSESCGFALVRGSVQKKDDEIDDLFWHQSFKTFGFNPETPRDIRQSIWAMAWGKRDEQDRWPREVVSALEKDFEIYTITDLAVRGRDPEFVKELIKHPAIGVFASHITIELTIRHRQLDSRSFASESIEISSILSPAYKKYIIV